VIAEAVAHSSDRFDEAATLSKLFSQAYDLNIHGALGHRIVISFDRTNYLISTEHPTRMFRQEVQDSEFTRGEIYEAISERNPKA